MKFGSYEDVREELAQARYSALERCVEAANREGCDLFVVAGDLFERTNVTQDAVLAAVGILSKFDGRAVLVLPGNHDFFLGPDSRPWSDFSRQSEAHGDRIMLLSEEKVYDLRHFDLDVSVLPAPCGAKHSLTHGLGWMPRSAMPRSAMPRSAMPRSAMPSASAAAPEADLSTQSINIGIAHGSIEGISPDFEGRYYPMSIGDLNAIAADVWLIGHTHRRFPDTEGNPGPTLFIPGTPEPDGFNCPYHGGAWILEVGEDRVWKYQAVETGTYRFVDINREFADLAEMRRVLKLHENPHALIRLIAGGTFSREDQANLKDFISGLRERVFYLRTDFARLAEAIDPALVNHEFTERSFPHRLLTSLLERGDQEAAQIAYRLLRGVRS